MTSRRGARPDGLAAFVQQGIQGKTFIFARRSRAFTNHDRRREAAGGVRDPSLIDLLEKKNSDLIPLGAPLALRVRKFEEMMKKITMITRVLLGLIFLGSGISFFLSTPPPMQGPIADFFKGMAASGYFFYLLKGTEITCGLFLIAGRFVPLALVALAPIILNIFLVHAFMMPSGLPLAIIIGILETYLAFFSAQYSPTIKQLFRKR